MGVAILATGKILTSKSPQDAAAVGATLLSDFSALGVLESSHVFVWNPGVTPDLATHDAGVGRLKTQAELDAESPTRRRSAGKRLLEELMDYGEEKYPVEQWTTIANEGEVASRSGLTNRQAYFTPPLAWRNTVLAEYRVRRNLLRTATTYDAINAVSTDFSSFDATFPTKISIVDGLAIPD